MFFALLLNSEIMSDHFDQDVDFEIYEINNGLTTEDRENLFFYKSLYISKINKDDSFSATSTIPEKAHFIWLNPAPFSSKFLHAIETFKKLHPAWEAHLWTDLEEPDLQLEVILHNPWQWEENPLKNCCFLAQTTAEKTEALKFAILLSVGGFVISDASIPLKSITPYQQGFNFFCTLSPLDTSFLSSVIRPSTSIIGCAPNHPILLKAVEGIKTVWSSSANDFYGKDPVNTVYRMQHVFSFSLDNALKSSSTDELINVIVLPHSQELIVIESELPVLPEELAASKLKNSISSLQRSQRKITWALTILCGLSLAPFLLFLKNLFRN